MIAQSSPVTDDFFPDGYEAPVSGGKYTKFRDGETTKIRILSKPVFGWEAWENVDGKRKPVRFDKSDEGRKQAQEVANRNESQEDKKVNYFWAMVVWNYGTSQTEILSITQKSVQAQITGYINHEDYGNPIATYERNGYDLSVTRTKNGPKTEYSCIAGVPKALDTKILDAYSKEMINLDALFTGDNPFA